MSNSSDNNADLLKRSMIWGAGFTLASGIIGPFAVVIPVILDAILS